MKRLTARSTESFLDELYHDVIGRMPEGPISTRWGGLRERVQELMNGSMLKTALKDAADMRRELDEANEQLKAVTTQLNTLQTQPSYDSLNTSRLRSLMGALGLYSAIDNDSFALAMSIANRASEEERARRDRMADIERDLADLKEVLGSSDVRTMLRTATELKAVAHVVGAFVRGESLRRLPNVQGGEHVHQLMALLVELEPLVPVRELLVPIAKNMKSKASADPSKALKAGKTRVIDHDDEDDTEDDA